MNGLQYALAGNINVNSRDISGNTPLMWAVKRNKPDIVAFLLQNGANPYVCDYLGFAPIDVATAQDYKQITELLERHKTKSKGRLQNQ
jgi:ankyrin repeat protein